MTFTTSQPVLVGKTANDSLFGGNILAPRGAMTGEGSYAEAIQDMGVTGLRYPGGSLTEFYFDIKAPDAATATHGETAEQTDFIPLSDFMNFAADMGYGTTIVLPTRDQLSQERDANGDRIPAVDEEILRDFIHDVMTGTYGDAEVKAFELGNEYWGSGQMNAAEYGRLSAEMAVIVSDELRLISEIYDTDTSSTHVIVQMGTNYDHSNLASQYQDWDSQAVIDDLLDKYPDADISYEIIRGNGDVNWQEVNNELIQMSFDTPQEQGAIDGIVAHVYSRGSENEASRYKNIKDIEGSWLQDEGFEDLAIYVTEWNQKSTDGLERGEDYGLYQAHEMLNIMEAFMAHGVDEAHVWPLIQNTKNSLATGMDYTAKTAPGEMFAMMSETIPGKMMLDFTPGGDQETELKTQDSHIHGFTGQDEIVFYIASTAEGTTTTEIDINGLIQSHGAIDIHILGMAEGEAPGDARSAAEIKKIEAGDVYSDGTLFATLEAGEIMQVVIGEIIPTEAFAHTMAVANGSTGPEIETTPDDDDDTGATGEVENPEGPESEEVDDSASSSSPLGDVGWILALLPLLALAGMAG